MRRDWSDVPKYIRPAIKAVYQHADNAGDGHAGWAAIADNWQPYSIACLLARASVRDAATAIAMANGWADEIVANTKR